MTEIEYAEKKVTIDNDGFLTSAHPEMSYFRTQDTENDYQK
jgi:hypothetical protein